HDPELRPVFDVLGRVASPHPATLFDSAAATSRIARFFNVATPESFGQFSRAELSAIAAAIAYVEQTQISERPPLARPEREENSSTLFIDAVTCAILAVVRILSGICVGSLLISIVGTVTGGGARLLVERLTAPLPDPAEIEARLDCVSFLQS